MDLLEFIINRKNEIQNFYCSISQNRKPILHSEIIGKKKTKQKNVQDFLTKSK